MGLNHFKVNMSYDAIMDCSLYELDFWIDRLTILAEEEEERQKDMQ